jgi:hypothetical protein
MYDTAPKEEALLGCADLEQHSSKRFHRLQNKNTEEGL